MFYNIWSYKSFQIEQINFHVRNTISINKEYEEVIDQCIYLFNIAYKRFKYKISSTIKAKQTI